MKKSHRFDELSDKTCSRSRCRKRLKKRLVESKSARNITKCYRHYLDDKRKKQAKKDKRGWIDGLGNCNH